MKVLKQFAILFLMPLSLIGQTPVAVNDTIYVYQNDSITIQAKSNDYDPDGGALTIETVIYGGTGVAANYAGFYITYSSGGSFTGVDYITYVVCDDDDPKLCDTGLVVVNVLNEELLLNDTIDINNVRALVNSDGTLFFDQNFGEGIFEVPKGSGKTTIFLSRMWMSGDDQFGQQYGAYGFYNYSNDIWPGPIMDQPSYSIEQDIKWNRLWKLKKSDIEYHIANYAQNGYVPTDDIREWPAHGDPSLGQAFYLAPFSDINANGIYDPENGDYPMIKGDQTAYFIYNDDKYEHGFGGNKMQFEVHGMLYSFDCPTDSALHNSVFVNYRLINRSPRTYFNCYLGQFTDFDIGDPMDDVIECDVKRSSSFGFNADSSSAQGVTVLAGPFLDLDLMDNPSGQCNESVNGFGFGDGEIDNERYGLTGSMEFCMPGCMWPTSVSATSEDIYQILRGQWSDGSTMRHGGTGHINNCTSCEYSRFMYPDESDACGWGTCSDQDLLSCGVSPGDPLPWNMKNAGTIPHDIRGVGSIGPFTVEPDQEVEVDLVFVYGNDYDTTDNKNRSIDIMKERIDSIRSYYAANSNPCGGLMLSDKIPKENNTEPLILLYPNPARSYLTIKLQSDIIDSKYQIFDLTGRLMLAGVLRDSEVNITSLPKGVFIIMLKEEGAKQRAKFVKL